MYETSVFKIQIDFEKSHGSYIYDQGRRREFLDFFGLYSSLPLGYNHPALKEKKFLRSYLRTASIKVANCEIISNEGNEFLKLFTSWPGKGYQNFWFCCTGGLAVEAAIKAAIAYKQVKQPAIVSLKNSFHGISGYGLSVTDIFLPVSSRLEGLPKFSWPKVSCKELYTEILKNKKNIAAVLVEPIQATFGDNYLPKEFFVFARKICDENNIVLIFDEIQTGFGATGKMWYWHHLDIEPDIVAFGKKAQVSGIMVKKKFGKIFDSPDKLSVTFDGDLSDMIRCRQILKAYKKYDILKNVQHRGEELKFKLSKISRLKNVRGQGLLVAFDFENHDQQLSFAKKAFENGLIFNRTRDVTIRLRPNLAITSEEIDRAIYIINASV